jgi:hypothetical protein
MGTLLNRYAELDVRRAVNRRVPGCVVVLFDFGPQPPAQADAKRRRKYAIERAEWEKETGNKPVELGLNSVDASAAKLYDPRRWRTSPTASAEAQIEPRVVTGQVISMDPTASLQAWLIYDVISASHFLVPIIDARHWLEADNRYQRAFF